MATIDSKGWANFGPEYRQEMLRDDLLAGKSVSLVLFAVIALGALAMALVTAFIVLTS